MLRLALVLGVLLYAVSLAAAQPPVGALAIDGSQGDQYGWAVDYETAGAAQARALSECGGGCRVVLTFNRCAAYAADQDSDSAAVGWAESFASSSSAQQAALAACNSRGGTACLVRVWGCNAPVVEESLGLDVALRQRIQRGLRAAGFDPGGADGLFGPRTRAAIRGWQSSRGAQATGYLDAASAAALRSPALAQATAPPPTPAAQQPPASSEVELVFWQSIVNSTNPADFEAYLRRFPNGVFSDLAQNRLEAMRGPAGSLPGDVEAGRTPDSGARVTGASVRSSESVVDGTARPGAVFRADQKCSGQPVGAACWQEISGRPGCHVWNPRLAQGSTVTWTGDCAGGLAQGMGTLTWIWDGNRQTATGHVEGGKRSGYWVLRFADGGVEEGPFVEGEPNGHWVLRFANGNVEEGPMVNGQQNGHWIVRNADGTVGEGPVVEGTSHGNWVIRRADGTVEEWLYRNGERVR